MATESKPPVIPEERPLEPATLRALAEQDTHGHRVLSIYVDLDPSRFPTPDTLETELGALFDEARRHASGRDVRVAEDWLKESRAAHQGVHGLALFVCSAAGLFGQVRLAGPVEPLVVVDAIPWLEPLAARITPGDWGVAVISRRAARLFRGGPTGLSEFASFTDEVYRRHAQGGWSQSRFQRGIEEQVAAHVRATTELLLRAHEREPFAHVVIVCTDGLRPVVEHALPGELRQRLAGVVDADLEHASLAEIASAASPLVERVEQERERDLVARLEQALGTGGPAAAGLDDVLASLEQNVVAVLLVAEGAQLEAGLCPSCGRLASDAAGRCPLDGTQRSRVDATEHAIDRATTQAADVAVLRWEQDWLHRHGDIAALLRW